MCLYCHRLLPGVALPVEYSFWVYLNELPCHICVAVVTFHSPGRSSQGSQSSQAVPPTQNHLCRTAWTEILRILYVAFKPIFVLQLERFYSLSAHCIGWVPLGWSGIIFSGKSCFGVKLCFAVCQSVLCTSNLWVIKNINVKKWKWCCFGFR